MLTVQQIASDLQVSEDTVLYWINSGQLQASAINAAPTHKKPHWRVAPKDLESFLKSRQRPQRTEQVLRSLPSRLVKFVH